MTELLKAWTLFSFSLGCWTGLTLLLSRRGERRARLCFAAFVGLLLLPPLNAYVGLVRGAVQPTLAALSVHLTWAFGPLLLLCVRQALRQPEPLPAWHALPLLLVNAGALAGWAWVDSLPLLGLLALQVLAYALAALQLLRRQRLRLQQLARQHANTTHYWLLFLAGGLAAASLFDLLLLAWIHAGRAPSQTLMLGAALLLGLYVNGIALFAVYQPEVFIRETEAPAQAAPEAPAPAVRAVELSPGVAQELEQRLQQLVQTHKPHLDEEMSLGKLAALLGVTPHQLSELLNVHLASSFYDYLNEQRHREALQLLAQPDQDLTVADIAYRAGFNNRNSFYKVFKDKTGVTPAQFRKDQAKRA